MHRSLPKLAESILNVGMHDKHGYAECIQFNVNIKISFLHSLPWNYLTRFNLQSFFFPFFSTRWEWQWCVNLRDEQKCIYQILFTDCGCYRMRERESALILYFWFWLIGFYELTVPCGACIEKKTELFIYDPIQLECNEIMRKPNHSPLFVSRAPKIISHRNFHQILYFFFQLLMVGRCRWIESDFSFLLGIYFIYFFFVVLFRCKYAYFCCDKVCRLKWICLDEIYKIFGRRIFAMNAFDARQLIDGNEFRVQFITNKSIIFSQRKLEKFQLENISRSKWIHRFIFYCPPLRVFMWCRK